MIERIPPSFAHLHPMVRDRFTRLAETLEAQYKDRRAPKLFRPFEVYRSPERQAEMVRKGVSKAGPWKSPHAFGFAVDFVPVPWSWEDGPHWAYLKAQAEAHGLAVPLDWDKPHVEAPEWPGILKALRGR